LDHSGSNGQNYKMSAAGDGSPDVSSGNFVVSPAYATDPKGLTRYGTATTPGTYLNYLANLTPNDPTDPQRYFASVDFNSSAQTYPTGSSGFTSDIANFYNHVATTAGAASGGAPNDSSGTSYLTALSAAYNIVSNDIQSAKACAAKATTAAATVDCPKPGTAISSAYVLVFMSDGSPIIKIDGVGTDSSGNTVITGPIVLTKESNAEILAKVGAIMDLKSNDKYVTSVNLYSIYYYFPGNIDKSGQSLLGEMAKAGNGLPYNALSGSNIDYSQFQPPKKMLSYTLADVFVTNASTVWWTDSKLHADTDGDGLPDDIEKTFGTNPLKYSTANNGVSDLVRYKMNAGAPNYKAGACSAIASSTINGVFTYKASDPNGLNDCEKLILNDTAGIGYPDSNKDNIPDFLEFINNIAFQSGTTPGVTTINQDGYTTYQKIKYSLPVSTSLTNVLGVMPSSYRLNQISSNASQSCYQLSVSDLPIIGDGNKVRVDVLLKSNLVEDNYLYKVGYKNFDAIKTSGPSLIFNDWNDPTEITNKTWSQWP
jgi:hypothetical protein